MKNRKRWITIVALVVLLAALGVIGYHFYNKYKTEQQYEDLRQKKIAAELTEAARAKTPTPKPTKAPTNTPAPSPTGEPEGTVTPTEEPKETPTPTVSPTPTTAVMLATFEELYEINHDFAGWITIADTPIDYPVMHVPGETAENGKDFYYLYRDFYGNPNTGDHKPGSIFVEGRCSLTPERSDNVMIYGHNMNAGTMFAGLHKFRDESFYKTHKTFEFDTLYSKDTYEIICVFIMQIGDQYKNNFKFYNYVDFPNKATFNYFIENIKALQLYDTGVEPEYGDELTTLITCTERAIPNGRLVVVGRKIKNNE